MTCAEIQAQLNTLNAQKTVAEADVVVKEATATVKTAAATAAWTEKMNADAALAAAQNIVTAINADISGYLMLQQMNGC